MGTGIWASGLGGRFRERAWRPGYGHIGMGMEYGDIGMGIGTQPYLSVSGCTSSERGFLPVAGASASEKGFLPAAGASASEKGFSASIRGLRQRKGFSASCRGLRQRLVLFFVPLALSENLSSPLEAALVLYSFHSLLNENLLCSFGSLKMVLLCL